jgi:EAL domain-containing protein (putative c-di-GMP-specific phosphodiesterase class I)/CheY-like chemotaxis protein
MKRHDCQTTASQVHVLSTHETLAANVLLVDDDAALLRLLTLHLLRAGYKVHAVRSGAEAVQRLRQHRYDVLLTDLMMPGLSGLELLSLAQQNAPETSAVLMTASPSLDSAVTAVDLGAARYVCKPLDKERLLEVVAEAALRAERLRRDRCGRELLDRVEQQRAERCSLQETFESAQSQIELAFQPIFHLPGRQIAAHEGLMRSSHATLASPPALLDAAERLGRIKELGRTVRKRAAWALEEGHITTAFVNLHSAELLDEQLGSPEDPLWPHARRVVLELTERAKLDLGNRLDRRLKGLRALGYRIAIDDLGTGYSSLSSVQSLEPDVVKLDRSLVHGIHLDHRRRALVGALVDYCKRSGTLVVAEGIEESKELKVVTELGCDFGQGYLLGRPQLRSRAHSASNATP